MSSHLGDGDPVGIDRLWIEVDRVVRGHEDLGHGGGRCGKVRSAVAAGVIARLRLTGPEILDAIAAAGEAERRRP